MIVSICLRAAMSRCGRAREPWRKIVDADMHG
jgi:hypothetical protein